MAKNNQMMTGLHAIKDEIASAVKKNDDNRYGGHENSSWEDPATARNNVSQANFTPRPEERKPVDKTRNTTVLDTAIARRCDDLFKSKKDLAARLAYSIATLKAEQEDLSRRSNHISDSIGALEKINAKLITLSDDDSLPATQSELSDACRALEGLRLETIALAASAESSVRAVSSASQSVKSDNDSKFDFNSLTAGQIFRFAFIASIPAAFVIIISAIIMAATYYAAIRGGFFR